MEIAWWYWVVGGLALALAELVTATFYIVWFGLAAILVGMVVWLLPAVSPTVQVVLWMVTSVAMVAAWLKVFKPSDISTRAGTADGDFIGETGLLVGAVEPFTKGRVRFQRPMLGAEEWVCISDEPIAAGERVRVASVEGSYVKVIRHQERTWKQD